MLPDRLAGIVTPWLGGGPAYAAVAAAVRGAVLDGRLPAGTRVPSEWTLAAALGLSRTTVSAAYDVLRDQGYLRSAAGAGSRVVVPGPRPTRPDTSPGEPPAVLDLTVAAPAAPHQLVDAVRAATDDLPALLADHGLHPYGLPVLREAVAAHLSNRDLPTAPHEVMITSGALHGWNLLLRALTRSGQRVLVEQPTYPAVSDAVRAQQLRPVALAVSASGWEAPRRGTVLAHVTPDAQNPTGLLADADQRRALLQTLDAPVVTADETFADLVLEGPAPPPLASVDTRSRVVTLGSMSKTFWAGLRVGWVRAAPELLARLAQARAGIDLTSPVLDQLVAARLLAQAPQVLAERRAALLSSHDALLAALADGLPAWRTAPPRAGVVLWVEMPAPSATRVAAHALDLGVRLAPGPRYTLDGTADRWLRLPFTSPPERAGEVVAVLREASARALDSAPAPRDPARWTA